IYCLFIEKKAWWLFTRLQLIQRKRNPSVSAQTCVVDTALVCDAGSFAAVAWRKPRNIRITPSSSLTYNQSTRPALTKEPAIAGIRAPAAISRFPAIRLASTLLRQNRKAE